MKEQRTKERLEKQKQLMEPQDSDVEEVVGGVEDIDTKYVESILRLPTYMSPQNPTSKVIRDLDFIKFKVFTPFLPNEVLVEGELLAKVPQLRMEDWDLNDQRKYPHSTPTST